MSLLLSNCVPSLKLPLSVGQVSFNTMINHYSRTQRFDEALGALERMQAAGLSPNDVTHDIFLRNCDVSPEQLQVALQRGTFEGIIPDDVYPRQQKGRERPRRGAQVDRAPESAASARGTGSEEGSSRTGAESLVEEEPSSSGPVGERAATFCSVCFYCSRCASRPISALAVLCFDWSEWFFHSAAQLACTPLPVYPQPHPLCCERSVMCLIM